MKKLVIILSLIFLGNLLSFSSSKYKPYPIPSYGQVVSNTAGFYELKNPGPNRQKRQMNVRTTSMSPKLSGFQVIIWLVADNGHEILGPFITECGELFTFQIDNQKWGVAVETDFPVSVDVWIDDWNPLP